MELGKQYLSPSGIYLNLAHIGYGSVKNEASLYNLGCGSLPFSFSNLVNCNRSMGYCLGMNVENVLLFAHQQ